MCTIVYWSHGYHPVCCGQVEVVGVNESLKRIAYDALTTRPNFAYTLKEVEADLKRVFATGTVPP